VIELASIPVSRLKALVQVRGLDRIKSLIGDGHLLPFGWIHLSTPVAPSPHKIDARSRYFLAVRARGGVAAMAAAALLTSVTASPSFSAHSSNHVSNVVAVMVRLQTVQ